MGGVIFILLDLEDVLHDELLDRRQRVVLVLDSVQGTLDWLVGGLLKLQLTDFLEHLVAQEGLGCWALFVIDLQAAFYKIYYICRGALELGLQGFDLVGLGRSHRGLEMLELLAFVGLGDARPRS